MQTITKQANKRLVLILAAALLKQDANDFTVNKARPGQPVYRSLSQQEGPDSDRTRTEKLIYSMEPPLLKCDTGSRCGSCPLDLAPSRSIGLMLDHGTQAAARQFTLLLCSIDIVAMILASCNCW